MVLKLTTSHEKKEVYRILRKILFSGLNKWSLALNLPLVCLTVSALIFEYTKDYVPYGKITLIMLILFPPAVIYLFFHLIWKKRARLLYSKGEYTLTLTEESILIANGDTERSIKWTDIYCITLEKNGLYLENLLRAYIIPKRHLSLTPEEELWLKDKIKNIPTHKLMTRKHIERFPWFVRNLPILYTASFIALMILASLLAKLLPVKP